MPSHPVRIYCVSIPGSSRRKKIRHALELSGLPYEFVSGVTVEDAPLKGCRLMFRYKHMLQWDIPYANAPNIIRSYGCKLAMARAMEKISLDGAPWSLLIQDDIILLPGLQDRIDRILKRVPAGIGAIACLDMPWGKYRCRKPFDGMFHYLSQPQNTEPCQLVRDWYAGESARYMRSQGAESDYCFSIATGSNPIAASAIPLAKYGYMDSTIDTFLSNSTF